MVPVQALSLEHHVRHYGEDYKTDALLYHLQLHKVERSAVVYKANAVCRHLAAILEEGYSPRESYDTYQRPVRGNATLL